MAYSTTLLATGFVTHDVTRYTVERPEDYRFEPCQATEVAIDRDEWRDEKRPFTFTSLDEDRVLEFTIKQYPEHEGVTAALTSLNPGAKLILGEPWGTIQYRGIGVFLAGGAGVTPFIGIMRRLAHDGELAGNKLIFSNKTARDVILEPELREVFGDDFLPVLTQEQADGYHHGRINEHYLAATLKDFSQQFYICGPKAFVADMKKAIERQGGSSAAIVIEE